MSEELRTVYEFFKNVSFWLLGVWLLIALSPVILPVLMIQNYVENFSEGI